MPEKKPAQPASPEPPVRPPPGHDHGPAKPEPGFVPHKHTGAPASIAFFDCSACGEEVHINGPDGIHELVCGHCGAEHLIQIGDGPPPMTAKEK